jgi:hypothetical protein
LYISISIERIRASYYSYGYKWHFRLYFDWRRDPGQAAGADKVAIAWGGGMAWISNSLGCHGRYENPVTGGAAGELDCEWTDGTAGAGVGWSFGERPNNFAYADYGTFDGNFYETKWQNRAVNVVSKYYHTWGDVSYDVSLSATPGITISPVDRLWGLACGVDLVV